jgi:predicted MPP superfamily phosphohydrolase
LKAWPVLGILFIEGILFLAHWFIYSTLVDFFGGLGATGVLVLRCALLPLAFSFIVAALLSYRFGNPAVTVLYKVAATWLGFLSFFFFAACASWAAWLVFLVATRHPAAPLMRPHIAMVCFGLAFAAGVYGMVNAYAVRIRRVSIRLPNLPASWIGRTGLLISDLHLGHINGVGFNRRIVALAGRLQPDIIFVPGDVFDGSKVEPDRLAAPFKQLAPPLGIYFSTGNHDEFGDRQQFLAALSEAGIHVLNNEKAIVDGLQILGVRYHETTFPMRLRTTLEGLSIDRKTASILLSHVPNRLPIVAEAGVSLQLSGHTHGGQFVPFTWFTRRVFGKFTHGLHSFGALQVYTSYGAGTWGPPMRVGTTPEIVLLKFE